jgi:peroxiredoxin
MQNTTPLTLVNRLLLCGVLGTAALTGCTRGEAADAADNVVHSYLNGTITISAQIDSTGNHVGTEVLVLNQDEAGELDTLGIATTDSTGAFRMNIEAPDRGVYLLVISRFAQQFGRYQIVVAQGDSASFNLELPADPNRPLLIRSPENAAWMAYQNVKEQHQQSVMQALQGGAYDEQEVQRLLQQGSNILWSLRDNFRGTVGADIASAEAIAMLENWNDSLLVARVAELSPENPVITQIAMIGRRSKARLDGQAAAIQFLQEMQGKVTRSKQKAELQAEIVVAYLDSLQQPEALAAAQVIKTRYKDEKNVVEWADKAIYEIEHLMPGMVAPALNGRDVEGADLNLGQFKGKALLVEFYHPRDPSIQQELALRNALYQGFKDQPVDMVAVWLVADSSLAEVLRDEANFPGRHILAPGGEKDTLTVLYNVNTLPTRYLIDQEGKIVKKFAGASLDVVQEELAKLLGLPLPSTPNAAAPEQGGQ